MRMKTMEEMVMRMKVIIRMDKDWRRE
jgi:hypothetical protein